MGDRALNVDRLDVCKPLAALAKYQEKEAVRTFRATFYKHVNDTSPYTTEQIIARDFDAACRAAMRLCVLDGYCKVDVGRTLVCDGADQDLEPSDLGAEPVI